MAITPKSKVLPKHNPFALAADRLWIPPMKDMRVTLRRKVQISLRVDADVLAWFKGQGKGYQTLMNAVLRRYMEG